MKVLHVIPSVSPIRGGPSQAVIDMVRSLRGCGVEAEIVTTDDDGPGVLDIPTGKWSYYGGVPVLFFPRYSPPTASIREFAFSKALTSWLENNLKAYDLVHIHAIFSYPSTIAMKIARQCGVPYIIRPLGQLCHWSLRQSALKKKAYLRLIERANLNGSQGLHFTTEQEKYESQRLDLKPTGYVIPHGLNQGDVVKDARQRLREKFDLSADQKIILFLSRIHPKKGLDYLIPALAKLKDCPFKFILAGSGTEDYEAIVRELLKSYDLQDRTILTGFVEGYNKALLLQGSDLFVLTSHSENFGVAVLEALAAGLPTVVTPGVALASELNEKKIGYVTELSVDAIAQQIEICLRETDDARRTGLKASQYIFDNYSWKQNSELLSNLYRDIVLGVKKSQYA